MVRRMGPIGNLLGMLPGMGQMKDASAQVDDRDLDRIAGDHPLDDAGRADRTRRSSTAPAGCGSPAVPASR